MPTYWSLQGGYGMSSNPRFKRLLEIRQSLSKASTAKYKALLNGLNGDDRIRSLLLYHGCGTGRWSAKRFQPQNLPSRGLAIESDEVDSAIATAKLGLLDDIYGDVMGVASACIRGSLIPADGHRFICADFSAIEGRVLAWMAGEMTVVDAYLEGKRMYCVAAAGVFGKTYEEIYQGRKHDPYKMMDACGKVIDLSGGYQGALDAFRNMERSLGLNLKLSDDQVRDNVYAWRDSRPQTVKLWRSLEDAAFKAVQNPGTLTTYRDIRFKVVGKFLLMRLPSNRLLYYFDPQIVEKEMPWKDDDGQPVFKDVVSYMAVDSFTKKWTRQYGYGGLWTENAVQATARDLMAQAMIRLEAEGYPVILTVHDELLAEVLLGRGSVEEFVKIMTIVPPWATGCPVAAEGWEGNRYRK